jgi:1-acyl-sn-glycerol-3-phosphate acyltransferase
MVKHIRYGLQGAIALIIMSTNTVIITLAILPFALIKYVTPAGGFRNRLTRWLSCLGEMWVSVNKWVLSFYRGMEWDVDLPENIDPKSRYLLICNHQSWVDIVVLQSSLNRRAPFMRFMLKQRLVYVPVLGVAWWALDMPFLRRFTREQLLKRPELKGKDLENAARACEKLKHIPVSFTVFPEGSRFTPEKKASQKSPYQHLLLPRTGGLGQVLFSFEDRMQSAIDVTIYYPDGMPTFWQLVSGQMRKVTLVATIKPIDEGLRGVNFRENKQAGDELKNWLNEIWTEKDQFLIAARSKDK